MARCPNCKARLSWDALACGACDASFETLDGWHPVPQNAREERLLRERERRQRSEIHARPEGSAGLKITLSLILLAVAFGALIAAMDARPGERYGPVVTGLACFILAFFVWVEMLYQLFLALFTMATAGAMIHFGLQASAVDDYLWTACGLAVLGAIGWLADRFPRLEQSAWFRIIGLSVMAGAVGVIQGTGAAALLVGLAFAVAGCTRAWILCTDRQLPAWLDWAADLTAAVPGQDAARFRPRTPSPARKAS